MVLLFRSRFSIDARWNAASIKSEDNLNDDPVAEKKKIVKKLNGDNCIDLNRRGQMA